MKFDGFFSGPFINGNIKYIAPELREPMITGMDVIYNSKTDAWSMGVVLLEFYLGQFVKDPLAEMANQPRQPSKEVEQIKTMLDSLLSMKPEAREIPVEKHEKCMEE